MLDRDLITYSTKELQDHCEALERELSYLRQELQERDLYCATLVPDEQLHLWLDHA